MPSIEQAPLIVTSADPSMWICAPFLQMIEDAESNVTFVEAATKLRSASPVDSVPSKITAVLVIVAVELNDTDMEAVSDALVKVVAPAKLM